MQATTPTPSKVRTPQALTIVSGGAIAVGSLLPWVTATHMFGRTSLAGTDGDGVFTLIIGVTVALLAWLRFDSSGGQAGVLIGCALAGIIGMNVLGNLSDSSSQHVLSSVGAGLYIMLIGAGLAAAATVAHMRSD